jgi:hypothetical protein
MAVQRYRAELQIDVDASSLDYWKAHAGAHRTIATVAAGGRGEGGIRPGRHFAGGRHLGGRRNCRFVHSIL